MRGRVCPPYLLMLKYGGGGHENASTCQVANDVADATLKELISIINKNG